jgi:hypothetical protein
MSDSPETNGPVQPAYQQPSYQQPETRPTDTPPAWAQATPGTGIEPQTSGEPVLVSIGDISVTQTRIYTPSGTRELNEVSWSVTDMSVTNQVIPVWAIVCAVIFFLLCLVGLLFLLVKETITKGSIQVTVHGPGFVHTTQVPVYSMDQIADINARVSYVRTLTASLPPAPAPPPAPPAPGTQAPGTQAPGTQARGSIWPQQGQGL